MDKILKIIILTALLSSTQSFRSRSGFIDLNIPFNRVLREIRTFLPVNMMINAVEQYESKTRELAYDLEACLVNLKGSVFFKESETFSEHQKLCLNNFFNFASVFETMRAVVFKFFSDTCPDELIDRCHDFVQRFTDEATKIEEKIASFIDFLMESDKTMKTLDTLLPAVKVETIETVVMNSILIINQENLYSQLNDVLQSKNEEIAIEEIVGSKGSSGLVQANAASSGSYTIPNKLKDDPFQNPDRYFLSDSTKVKLKDLHIVFASDSGEKAENQLVKIV